MGSVETAIKTNLKEIYSLIDKIYSLKKELVSLGINISEDKKIETLGKSLVYIATKLYTLKDFEYTEKCFILAINYTQTQAAFLNLSFMLRRNETSLTN